jgi:integrase
MTNDDRCRLLTPEGEPATLFLSATSGGPMAAPSVGEITADTSRLAEAVAEHDGRWFPHVHTHDLRHTYATHLAAVFLLGGVNAGRDLHGEHPRLDVQSAVKMASVGLGHLDESTTHLYIQQVGLMVAAGYTTSDFLGLT